MPLALNCYSSLCTLVLHQGSAGAAAAKLLTRDEAAGEPTQFLGR
jgi:hypothetical protein